MRNILPLIYMSLNKNTPGSILFWLVLKRTPLNSNSGWDWAIPFNRRTPPLLRLSLRMYPLRIRKIKVPVHNPPRKKRPFCSKIRETDSPTHSEISPMYSFLPLGIPTPSIGGMHIINGISAVTPWSLCVWAVSYTHLTLPTKLEV